MVPRFRDDGKRIVNTSGTLLFEVEYVMVNFKSKAAENQQGGENDIKRAIVRVALHAESNQLQADRWSPKGHR